MKRILPYFFYIYLLGLSVFLFPFAAFASDKGGSGTAFTDVFPKPSELSGGASGWIASDAAAEKGERCVLYRKDYTYYSTKKERILDIERNNTYSVSVRVFACDNLDVAAEKYKELSAVDEKIKSKKMTNPAPFGEKGVLLALPSGERSADFYITFLFHTFVVQVYSNDGFAQIDMASDIEKRLSAYLKKSGIDFYLNKINLEIDYKGKSHEDQVKFAGDDISVVILEGKVFDAANKPLDGAKITARETGQSGVSGPDGKYSFEISSGWGKAVYLSKMIFLRAERGNEDVIPSGMYFLKAISGGKTSFEADTDIFISSSKVMGKIRYRNGGAVYPLSGASEGNEIAFASDCPGATSPACRRVFRGTREGDFIRGEVSGGGITGKFVMENGTFSVFAKNEYLRDAGLFLQRMKMKDGKIFAASGEKASLDNLDNKSYIKLSVSGDPIKNKFYFKKGALSLKIDGISLEKEAKLVLYEIVKTAKGTFSLKEISPLASLDPRSPYVSINADISGQLRNPSSEGYALGLKGGGKRAALVADTAGSYAELYYYADTDNYKPESVVSLSFKTFEGQDITSNANKIKSDGEKDLVLGLKVALAGRTLQSLEITGRDGSVRRWNTNPFDIYPAAALVSGGIILNEEDGSVDVKLEKEVENFKIYLYNGSFNPADASFTVKCTIDGRTYESPPLYLKGGKVSEKR